MGPKAAGGVNVRRLGKGNRRRHRERVSLVNYKNVCVLAYLCLSKKGNPLMTTAKCYYYRIVVYTKLCYVQAMDREHRGEGLAGWLTRALVAQREREREGQSEKMTKDTKETEREREKARFLPLKLSIFFAYSIWRILRIKIRSGCVYFKYFT